MIYADNAATTALDLEAFEVMKTYFLLEYGNASQPYFFSKKAKKTIRKAREIIAECINAEPEEIYFTSGGTESDNWALKSIMLESDNQQNLITSNIEHHAILNSANALEKLGYPVIYLPANSEGLITSEILKQNISNKTKLVSVMFSNNEIGTIQPIKQLAQISHEVGALFHTDAVQAVGHTNIDVKELDVDMLSASAHKFNGPKGIGFLYKKNNIHILPYIDGGQQEKGLRAGTENVAAIIGMAIALKNSCNCINEKKTNLFSLENALLNDLKKANIDFIRNGSIDHMPGNISLSFKNVSGEMLLHRLDLKKICISTGSACDSVNTQISHVLKAINLDDAYAKGTIRISFGKNNTIEEAHTIAEELIKILT